MTKKQRIWLDQYGGRTETDLKENEQGKYIQFSDRKVYLPDDRHLILHFRGRNAGHRPYVEKRLAHLKD